MYTATTSPIAAPEEQSGEYLLFILGRDTFGLAAERVRAIFEAPEIVPVPHPPGPMRGTATLRGDAIPVLDFRRRFRSAGKGQAGEGYVIVAEVFLPTGDMALVGALVDDAEPVARIPLDAIEPPPRFGAAHAGHARGVARVNGARVTLLDLDRVVLGEKLDDYGWLRGDAAA